MHIDTALVQILYAGFAFDISAQFFFLEIKIREIMEICPCCHKYICNVIVFLLFFITNITGTLFCTDFQRQEICNITS